MLLEKMMNEIAIHVQNAYKVFHKQSSFPWQRRARRETSRQVVAVDNVSFNVSKGEIFGVLGPNGSGKSTLVRLIATLLLPDGGFITVFNHDVVRDPMDVQRLINRVSVEASFFKKLSPMENLSYGARLYGLNNRQARLQIRAILDRL